jgi:predicted MFS family arabinose efflux permease
VLSGFVTLFLSFLLWDQPLPGVSSVLALGLVGVAAGAGNGLGSFIGNRIGDRSPTVIASAALLVAIAAVLLVTLAYSLPTVVLLGLVSGAFGQLAKLCLDALIQDDTADSLRAQAFSWSETRLQAAWVGGGSVGDRDAPGGKAGFWRGHSRAGRGARGRRGHPPAGSAGRVRDLDTPTSIPLP